MILLMINLPGYDIPKGIVRHLFPLDIKKFDKLCCQDNYATSLTDTIKDKLTGKTMRLQKAHAPIKIAIELYNKGHANSLVAFINSFDTLGAQQNRPLMTVQTFISYLKPLFSVC